MRTRRLVALVAGSVAALFLSILPAAANPETQTITGTVSNSISVALSDPDLTPAFVVGTNEFTGGSLTVSSNVLTSVGVSFDQTAMSEWDTGTSAYVTDGNSLATALTLTAVDAADATNTGTATSGSGGALVGTNLLGDTVFNLDYSQPVLMTDPAGTYHIEVTFTATSL